jgi:hypothetical protein
MAWAWEPWFVYKSWIIHGLAIISLIPSTGQDTLASYSLDKLAIPSCFPKVDFSCSRCTCSCSSRARGDGAPLCHLRSGVPSQNRSLENCAASLAERGVFKHGIERRVAEVAKQRIARRIPVQSTRIKPLPYLADTDIIIPQAPTAGKMLSSETLPAF